MMNTLTSIAQITSPIVNLIFIVVLGVGYYYQWKVSRKPWTKCAKNAFLAAVCR